MQYNIEFWNALDELVNNSEIIIDRTKGTAHPKYPDFIYRVDYAAAKRKYETGKGFTVDAAINEMTSIGIDAMSQTTIFDKEGNLVEWNQDFSFKQNNRCVH